MKVLSFIKSLGILEFSLIQVVFYLVLWLSHEYLATLITVIFVPIFLFILIVSLIAELLERSKVPKQYFIFMLISVIIPIAIGLFFLNIYDGVFDWVVE